MTTESHVFKAIAYDVYLVKKNNWFKGAANSFMFLFCGEGTWHYMCHFIYFYCSTHHGC